MPKWLKSITCEIVHLVHPRLWDLVSIIFIATAVNLLAGALPTILGEGQVHDDPSIPKLTLTAAWTLATGVLCFFVAGIAARNHEKGVRNFEERQTGKRRESILYFAKAASPLELWTELATLVWIFASAVGLAVLLIPVLT